jgi:hypothetical protein
MKNIQITSFIAIIAIIAILLIMWGVSTTYNLETNSSGLFVSNRCRDPSQVNLHLAKALVLSCIDFRLRDNIKCNLSDLGYKNDYDEFILAGTTLGYNGINGKFTHWANVADDHIKLAFDLHKIDTIILIDHMHCGAYKVGYGLKETDMGTEIEYNLHKENLEEAAKVIEYKYNGSNPNFFEIPNLKIKKYIISIDGGKKVDIDQYTGSFPF